MNISVRVNGSLAEALGTSRLTVQLAQGATLASLVADLGERYPQSKGNLARAVPMVGGKHADRSHVLSDDQEIALLMPIAGG